MVSVVGADLVDGRAGAVLVGIALVRASVKIATGKAGEGWGIVGPPARKGADLAGVGLNLTACQVARKGRFVYP